MIGATQRAELYSTTLVGRLERAAREVPDKVLIACDGDTLTRRELWERSGQLALGLEQLGVQPGSTVGVLGSNSVWHHLSLWACLRFGALWAPMNPGLRSVDLGYTIRDLDPAVMFIEEELHDVYRSAGTDPVPTIALASYPEAADVSITELTTANNTATPPQYPWRPGEPAFTMYSGGTTGMPKGIVLPHAVAALAAAKYEDSLGMEADDVLYSSMQMYHFWPLMVLTTALYCDLTCHIVRRFSASRWLDEARACRATVVDPFLPMIAMLMRRIPERADDRNNPIRKCMGGFGADEFSEDLRTRFERRFDIRTYNMYGLTEAPNITYECAGAAKRGSTGRVGEWFDVRIVDEDEMPVSAGEVGEIVFRPIHPHQTALGYRNQAARTVDAWRNLWIHSGDRGSLDEEDYLYFRGRMDHFARIRGENVALSEVEGVAQSHPSIFEAGAVAVPSELGEDEIKLCVVAREPIPPNEIVRWFDERVARFKAPRYVEFVQSLPRSVTKQEVERFKLKGTGTRAPGVWDREEVEKQGTS